MTATTIKLDSAVRDRLNAAARERGLTAGSFVEEMLDAWAREQRFAAIRQALSRTSGGELESWRIETAAFDAVSDDGLDVE